VKAAPWLDGSHRQMMMVLVGAVEELRLAEDVLRARELECVAAGGLPGEALLDGETGKAHPMVAVRRHARADVVRLLMNLGFAPTAQSNMLRALAEAKAVSQREARAQKRAGDGREFFT